MEFRVCVASGGGHLIDLRTSNEEKALIRKQYLEMQGKDVKIMVYSYLYEEHLDYEEYKRQIQSQKETENHEKYKQLEMLIVAGTGRDLTGEEKAFLNWLVCSDTDKFKALKGILEDMNQ